MISLVDAPDGATGEYAPTPIDVFLRRQQTLTPVDRFAAEHVGIRRPVESHNRWQERLPASAPGVGQQYGFEVDLDACTGCKACVAACHSLNGLDDGESWRRVGTLHSTTGATGPSASALQTVTHACHHCVDPACLNGCPANAYEKDPVTGIVRHLDDDCIGCSYCTLTCPYEVPVYNASIGIVRKCDMCTDRLAEGEAPACVQGCPQGAITIALVDVDELVAEAREDRDAVLVPGAPESRLTVPTTRYRSATPLDPSLVAADARSVIPGEGHRPLAVMLVLTQAAVGMLVVAAWLRATSSAEPAGTAGTPLATIGLVTGLAALGASILHLGRPLLAWRAVLGIRRSWLSREIVAFGVFAAAAVLDTALVQLGAPRSLTLVSLSVAVVAGLAGVACSAQLYAVTRRAWWRWRLTGVRFVATMVVAGALGTAAAMMIVRPAEDRSAVAVLVLAAAVATATAIVVPAVALRRSADLATTAYLLPRTARDRVTARIALAVVGTVLVPAMALAIASEGVASRQPGVLLGVAWVLAVLGEYHERRLFFLASVGPRMPGQLR